jgi:hypothetical protein
VNEWVAEARRMAPSWSREIHATFAEARARESQLKRWSRPKKEALIRGDLDHLRVLSQSQHAAQKTPRNANCQTSTKSFGARLRQKSLYPASLASHSTRDAMHRLLVACGRRPRTV